MGTEVSQTSQELCTSTAYNDRPGTRPHGSSRRANNGNGKGGMTLAGSAVAAEAFQCAENQCERPEQEASNCVGILKNVAIFKTSAALFDMQKCE
ncbi:uncharacterized protein B0T23DRAFT_406372 [Neurospora hispaniola]|uniref:Uncharacterized protein n=1 Tax=Neurospora hispaniola TaxID=588809 RepID=A0AAJ0I3K8_9PEZI|nr:hypothetical protein B0T23DRAFT_406372 [Neurospora hispaniola]